MKVTDAAEEHIDAIAAIYARAARASVATFDFDGHSRDWWLAALREVDPGAGRLLLVALGDGGEVLGYAKSGEHKTKAAYRTTCETSVYVAEEARGGGVGGVLYDELLARLDASPLRLAVGGVTEPNPASARLHLSRGFRAVGTFHRVGAKHGRVLDVTWYERPLARPPLVEEVAQASTPEAAAEAIGRALRRGASVLPAAAAENGATAIVDQRDGSALGALAVDPAPDATGEVLLLEWCAEALAPLLAQSS